MQKKKILGKILIGKNIINGFSEDSKAMNRYILSCSASFSFTWLKLFKTGFM